jgi:large subunit ribosomal protein L24
MKIKKDDQVVVISGEYASQQPRKVLQVLDDGRKMIVQGVNQVYKHVRKGHPKSPSGGRLHMEMPIQSSNVMYFCESCQKPSRLGLRLTADNQKERYCKKCGTSCGEVGKKKVRLAQASQ